MTEQRIPITVIGGFLGAGKTTLVNHLIHSGVKRFGVIVNEFGKLGIDGGLIETLDPDGVAELTNGCLCCVGRNDVIESLIKLATRPTPPEHVLIELSGVADPVPVLQTLLDPVIRQAFDLDGLVAVIDAKNFVQSVQDNPETVLQLAYATCLVVNKTDIASPEQTENTLQHLQQLNPLATLLPASHSQVEPQDIIKQGSFNPTFNPEHQTVHTKGIKSFTLSHNKPLSLELWNGFLQQFILASPDKVLRVKGYLAFDQIPDKVLFQAVRDVFSAVRLEEAHEGNSQIVVIGQNLNPEDYQNAFAACSA